LTYFTFTLLCITNVTLMKKKQEPPGVSTELKGKTLLVVHSGTPGKKFILQRLKKLGVKIILLNFSKNWATPIVDHLIISDLNNHKETIQQVDTFLKAHKDIRLDGILTFWEESVLVTSKLTDYFRQTGIPYSISRKIRNKYLFRKYCKSIGLETPRYFFIKNLEDTRKLKRELTFPIVLKPVYGSSSAFVIKVDSPDDVQQTYEYIKRNIHTHPDSAEWDSLEIYAEEYIDGDEVDIDMILQNGKLKFWSISDNYKTNEPFFVETGQSIPTTLPFVGQKLLKDMAEESLEKLGIQNGVIHFEAKINKYGPMPIEVNLRMGGDEVYSFVKGAWNIDLVDNAAKIACNIYIDKVEKPDKPRKYITGSYFLSPHSGVLVQLDIKERKINRKPVEEFHFYKKIGDPVLVPPEGFEYLGWITTSGENINDARENLDDAIGNVDYKVAKYTPTSAVGKTLRKTKFGFASINKDLILRAAKFETIKHIRSTLRNLHIGIAHNGFINGNSSSDEESLNPAKDIEKILQATGYKTTLFDLSNIESVFKQVRKNNIDIIINISRKINDQTGQTQPAAILDLLQLPYTGSSALTLGLCADRIQFKKILMYHEIPTPKWDYMYSLDEDLDESLTFPLVVKSGRTYGSDGITNKSIVTNAKDLYRQITFVLEKLKSPALIEEYIDGDEYDVSILGSDEDDIRILPLSRSIFDKLSKSTWHVYSRENKKFEDLIDIQQPPKNVATKLLSLITEIAHDAYTIFDCWDHGNVKIKVDKNNNPYILSVNPNPSLGKDSDFAYSAKIAKMKYIDIIEEILRSAIRRYKKEFNT